MAARLQAAEDAVTQAADRAGQLEVARDDAVAALANPARISYGGGAADWNAGMVPTGLCPYSRFMRIDSISCTLPQPWHR
jgi:hypothetical protein